jgi:DNA-binding NtrC family response regulator
MSARPTPRFEQIPVEKVPFLQPSGPSVLNVSSDLALLNTRTAILEIAGIRATAAANVRTAVRAIQDEVFNAVVLCHTVNAKDRAEIVREARKVTPKVRVIEVFKISSAGDADICVDSHAGPEALIATLRHLR